MSEYIRTNVHITSSGMLSSALLHHTVEVTTIDRLLFSTDYPFQRPSATDIRRFLTEFEPYEYRDKCTADNGRKLFTINDDLPTMTTAGRTPVGRS